MALLAGSHDQDGVVGEHEGTTRWLPGWGGPAAPPVRAKDGKSDWPKSRRVRDGFREECLGRAVGRRTLKDQPSFVFGRPLTSAPHRQ
jgi:hypothetical protein